MCDRYTLAPHVPRLRLTNMKSLQVILVAMKIFGGFPFSREAKPPGRLRVNYFWMLYSVILSSSVFALAVAYVSLPSVRNPTSTTSVLSTRLWEYGTTSTLVLCNLYSLLRCRRLAKIVEKIDSLAVYVKVNNSCESFDAQVLILLLLLVCGFPVSIIGFLGYDQMLEDHDDGLLWTRITCMGLWFMAGLLCLTSMIFCVVMTKYLTNCSHNVVLSALHCDSLDCSVLPFSVFDSKIHVSELQNDKKEDSTDNREINASHLLHVRSCQQPSDLPPKGQLTLTHLTQLENSLLDIEEMVELLVKYMGTILLVIMVTLSAGTTLMLYFLVDIYLTGNDIDLTILTAISVMLVLLLTITSGPDQYNEQVKYF